MSADANEDGSSATSREPDLLRKVGLPREHGGWSLVLEPAILGLLLRPSAAAVLLVLAAPVAFLLRTPLRIVLVDVYRRRRLHRTNVAIALAGLEATVVVVLVVAASWLARAAFWFPAIIATPFVALAFLFEARSRGRRLLPEWAGSVGAGAAAAMIILASGGGMRLAIGAWLILASRATSALVHVRTVLARRHGRATSRATKHGADVLALAGATAAAVVSAPLLPGSLGVLATIVFQRLTGTVDRPPRTVGLRELALGVGVVIVTAVGYHVM